MQPTLTVYFDGNIANSMNGETEICIDAECVRVLWWPAVTDGGTYFGATLSDGVSLNLHEASAGTLSLRAYFAQFVDGQERALGITIVNASGMAVLDLDRSIRFERYRGACGQACVRGSDWVHLGGVSDAGAEASADANRPWSDAGVEGSSG